MNGDELTPLLSLAAVSHAARCLEAGHEVTTLRTPARDGPVFEIVSVLPLEGQAGGIHVHPPTGGCYRFEFTYEASPRIVALAMLAHGLRALRREWFT